MTPDLSTSKDPTAASGKDVLTPFKLEQLQGIFYIYLLSVIVSSLVLFLEITCHKCKTKSEGIQVTRKEAALVGISAPEVVESITSTCTENDC